MCPEGEEERTGEKFLKATAAAARALGSHPTATRPQGGKEEDREPGPLPAKSPLNLKL